MFEAGRCHVAAICTAQSINKNNNSINDVLTSSAGNILYNNLIYIVGLLFSIFVLISTYLYKKVCDFFKLFWFHWSILLYYHYFYNTENIVVQLFQKIKVNTMVIALLFSSYVQFFLNVSVLLFLVVMFLHIWLKTRTFY